MLCLLLLLCACVGSLAVDFIDADEYHLEAETLAHRFHHDETCLRLRAELEQKVPSNMECGATVWTRLIEKQWTYVKVPKTGSTSISGLFDKAPYTKEMWALRPAGGLQVRDIPSQSYITTSVRAPIDAVRAGYAEIDRHYHVQLHNGRGFGDSARARAGYTATWQSIGHGDEPYRFEQFIDDLWAGRLGKNKGLTYWPAHAYPQAHTLACDVPRIDAIMRLERLERDVKDVAAKLDAADVFDNNVRFVTENATPRLSEKQIRALKQHQHERRRRRQHSGKAQSPAIADLVAYDRAFSLPSSLTQKLCDLYEVDFVCFGYDFPSECVQSLTYHAL